MGVDPGQLIDGLGGRQVVAHGAYAAQALHQHGDLPVGVSLNETLKAPELNDVEIRPVHFSLIVQVDGDPPVPFDTGNRVYDNFSAHGSLTNHI